MRRLRLYALVAAGCLVIILSGLLGGAPSKVRITISRETTYVSGPVNEDGTINYVAALNAMSAKGVTPENNAAIPLLRALGPEVLKERVRGRVLEALNVTTLPAEGRYFVDWDTYVQKHLPDAERAGEMLEAAMKAPWSAKDQPVLAQWVQANREPLALVEEGAKRPRYFMPLVSVHEPPTLLDSRVPSYGLYRYVAKVLLARAMMRAGDDDFPGARADLLTAHRLARLVSQSPTLIERLVALQVESLASSAGAAASRSMTAEQAILHLKDLESLPPLPSMADTIDKCERLSGLDSLMLLARGGYVSSEEGEWEAAPWRKWEPGRWGQSEVRTRGRPVQWVDWDTMLLTYNSWYTRLASAGRMPTFAQRMPALEPVTRHFDEVRARAADKGELVTLSVMAFLRAGSWSKVLTQRLADLLFGMSYPTLERALIVEDRTITQKHLAELALALAAYRGEQGKYPEDLSALKPKYLREIPDDRFTDKPLQYRLVGKGYLLYSVGEDMRDDGGKEGVGEGSDIVVRVE